jgi:TetR/AcrR family transcriptional regulator, transcriptional repressor for nem operon
MARAKAFDETVALEKAMQVFWKKGYNATSMEELVTAMGINRASLYDTFGDKKQLYLSALRRFQQNSQKQNATAVALGGHSPRAQLVAILEASLSEALQDPEQKGCMMANATAEMAVLDHDIYQFVRSNICTLEVFFEKLIQEGQAVGEFKAALDPAVAANFLINYVHGMRLVSKTKPDPIRMQQGLKLALNGLNA